MGGPPTESTETETMAAACAAASGAPVAGTAAPAETTRDISNPWGKPAGTAGTTAAAAVKPSNPTGSNLAEIMAEEEAERVARQVETEEELMMREAMEASLLDASPAVTAAAALPTAQNVIDGLDEDMRLAIELSLKESGGGGGDNVSSSPAAPAAAAAAAAAAQPHDPAAEGASQLNINETEAEAIARAIQEADDAEAAASLKLAMELQREEEEESKRQAASVQASRQRSGNVTTMDHDDFLYEQTGDDGEEHEERQLWGANDYDRYQEQHGAYEKYQQQYGPGNGVDEDDEGFRMNAATPSKTWSRLNRNIIVGPNSETRTKHDIKLKAQSNATRLLGSQAQGCRKGGKDVDGPIGIPDQAYNSLRHNIKKRGTVKGVERHGHGRAEEYGGRKTRGGAMDGNVRLLVTGAINTGLINGCNGVVKEGKEAIVYHANAGLGTVDDDGNTVGGSDGMDVAVKVFKHIQEFKGRRTYVDGDPRYHRTKFKNTDPRKQVEIWAEKEYRNLLRANRAGVPVPTPLMQKENVLFMRFLGEEGWPSPQLREVEIKKGSKKWTTLYGQVMVAVRRLYHCARLVHGDLSEYNILLCPSQFIENNGIWESKDAQKESGDDGSGLEIVLIDFGQAVERQHPQSKELLLRDLTMVRSFFVKQGIHVLSEDDAAEFILAPCETEENGEQEEEGDRDGNGDIGGDDDKQGVCSTSEKQDGAEDGEEDGGQSDNEEEKVWRYTIPSWDDAANLDRLQEKLKATKIAK